MPTPDSFPSQFLVLDNTVDVLDVLNAKFPINIKFGNKEYVLIKTKFGGLVLNGKNRSSRD
jgi:hypothetical protein